MQQRSLSVPALPPGIALAGIVLQGILAGVAVAVRQELIALGVVLGLAATVLMVRFPIVWLSALALVFIPLFLLQGPQVDVGEVVVVAWLLGSALVWVGWQALVVRRQLIRGWADLALMAFLVISVVNLPIALLNQVPLEDWLRRWFPMWLLVLFLPIRTLLRTPRQLLLVLSLLLLSGVFLAVAMLERYRSGVLLAEYAYQLRSGYARTQGEHFLAFAIVSCVVGAAFLRSVLWRLFLLLCALVMATAVLVTFSRTAWLSVLLGLGAAWLCLTWRQRLRVVLTGTAVVVLAVGTLTVAFPRVSAVLLRLLEYRFLSIGQGRRDLAVQGRFLQLEKAWQKTWEYPLGGHGAGSKFPYYESGARRHIHYEYIHNGYIATAYRYGVPLAILLVVGLVGQLVQALRALRTHPPGSIWQMAGVIGVAGLVGVLFSLMMTENPLDVRLATLGMAWILGLATLQPTSHGTG